jgi:hypothetical protein
MYSSLNKQDVLHSRINKKGDEVVGGEWESWRRESGDVREQGRGERGRKSRKLRDDAEKERGEREKGTEKREEVRKD